MHDSRRNSKRSLFSAAPKRAAGLPLMALLSVTILLSAQPTSCAEHSADVSEFIKQAEHEFDVGRYADAERLYRDIVKAEPGDPDIHNQLGLCIARQKRFTDAAGQFKQALKINPKHVASLHNLGSLLYRGGQFDEAITNFKREAELQTVAEAETLTCLADAYRDRSLTVSGAQHESDLKDALQTYEAALKVDPNFATAHNHLGLYYFYLDRYDEAAIEIRKAIAIKQDYAAAYYNLALLESKRGRFSEAADAFRNSLRYETEPEYKQEVRRKMAAMGVSIESDDYLSKGYDLLSQKKWSEAATLMGGVVGGVGAKDAIAWNNLGVALTKQSKLKEAIQAFQSAVSLMPNKFPGANYNLGQAQRLFGDLQGAEQSLRKSIQESLGANAPAHNALGMVLKQRKNLKEAASQYRLAIAQSGDTLPVAHFNLAMVYEKEPSKKKDAIAQYKRYLEQAPQGINNRFAMERIQKLSNADQ